MNIPCIFPYFCFRSFANTVTSCARREFASIVSIFRRIFLVILFHCPCRVELLHNCLAFRNRRQPNRGAEATFLQPYLAATSTLGIIIIEWKIIRGRYRVQILKHTFRIVNVYTRCARLLGGRSRRIAFWTE